MGRDAAGDRYTATTYFVDSVNAFFGIQVVKYDPEGNMAWNLRLNRHPYSALSCRDMAVSADGEVVMMLNGPDIPSTSDSALIVKLDANGALAWARSFLPDGTENLNAYGACVTLTANGDILAGGIINTLAGTSFNNLFLARISSSGMVLWSKRNTIPGTSSGNRIGGIVEDAMGAIMVLGQTDVTSAGSWLLKLNSTGEPVWGRKYSTSDVAHVRPILLAAQGAGYVLFYNAGIGVVSAADLYRVNTDANGHVTSAMRYGSEGQIGEVLGVTLLPNGGFAMAGYSAPMDEDNYDATLFTTDGAGAVQWGMHYGSTGTDGSYAAEPGLDGGFLAGGWGEVDSLAQVHPPLPWMCYLVKTDANGNSFGCEGPLNITSTPLSFSDQAYSITVTEVTGWANVPLTMSTSYAEITACPTIGVNELMTPALGLYPNPASEQITLTSGIPLRSVQVLATDGRIVCQQLMLSAELDIHALAPGAYILHALDVQGNVLRGRFLKE